MRDPRHRFPELARLLGELTDGCLNAVDRARLLDLLRNDPTARACYLDYIDLHVALYREYALAGNLDGEAPVTAEDRGGFDAIVSPPSPASVSVAPGAVHPSSFVVCSFGSLHSVLGGALFSYVIAGLLLAIGVLAAWAWNSRSPGEAAALVQKDASPAPDRPDAWLPIVGTITAMKDCQWPDPKSAVRLGAHVQLGQKIALGSGLLEITYDRSAKVVLEGPAAYEAVSPNGGFLASGRLTATVEKAGRSAKPAAQSPANRQAGAADDRQFFVRTPTSIVRGDTGQVVVWVEDPKTTYVNALHGQFRLVGMSPTGRIISIYSPESPAATPTYVERAKPAEKNGTGQKTGGSSIRGT